MDQKIPSNAFTTPLEIVPAPPIVLLRHGETHWNRIRRYQGQQDSPLSLNGIGQVRAIARTLRDHIGKPERFRLWSSPLGRTRQSMAILCEEMGLSIDHVTYDDRLKEHAYGRWEELTMTDIAARFPEDLESERRDRWLFVPPGGESFAQIAERLRGWLTALPGDQPAIVMAHGACGRVLRGLLVGMSPQEVLALDNPQSTAFRITGGEIEAIDADPAWLKAMGCDGPGLGVRI